MTEHAAAQTTVRLARTTIDTPLGPMVAGASARALVLLEFADPATLERQLDRARRALGSSLEEGDNDVLEQARGELADYFAGRRRVFDVPIEAPGSEFQRSVWRGLLEIPYGETRSYTEQARAIGRPDAVRAVARANGGNRIAIVIPCHRVLGASGQLTGYAGEVWRKRALLDLERPPAQLDLERLRT